VPTGWDSQVSAQGIQALRAEATVFKRAEVLQQPAEAADATDVGPPGWCCIGRQLKPVDRKTRGFTFNRRQPRDDNRCRPLRRTARLGVPQRLRALTLQRL